MKWTGRVRRTADDAIVAVARVSQALAIESVDRAVGVRPGKPVTPLQLLTRLELAAMSVLTRDPAKLVDERYELAQSLWTLHREFAQRLFDVMDPRQLSLEPETPTSAATIVMFPDRRAQRPR